MEPKYKVNPLTGELQEYVFEYNGILALRNFTAKVEDERLILHAADDVNFSILEALVSEVEINGVVYDNPTAAQEALTRLTFNQNRPVLLDKSLKDLILNAVQKIPGKQLTTEDFTTELRTKLEGLQQVDTSGLLPKGTYTGNASSLKADIDKKVDKVAGKGLSSNDYTNEEKRKNEENALKRVAKITVTGDVNKIITITFADSTVMQAPFKDNDHIPLADVNMNSLNFNVNTGVLTGVKSDGNAITVTLDGRYSLISHNHDERYAAKTHTHSEYAYRTHRHNKDDIDGLPNNLATAESVKTAIEGIQIGGRNLLRRSNTIISNNEYLFASYQITEDIKPKDVLTLSIDSTLAEGCKVQIFAKDDDGNYGFLTEGVNTFDSVRGYTIPKWTYVNLYMMGNNTKSKTNTIRKIKLERGNIATMWSPAPEDLIDDITIGCRNLALNTKNWGEINVNRTSPINITRVNDIFPNLQIGVVYKVSFDAKTTTNGEVPIHFEFHGGGAGLPDNGNVTISGITYKRYSAYIRWNDNKNFYVWLLKVGNNVTIKNIKIYIGTQTEDWTPAPEDAIPVPRAGVAIGSNWTAVVEHQNNTIFVENSLSIELNQLQNMGSLSFIKTFDAGAVTFTCAGKNIIYPFDNTFNGKKGSTAVVSIHNNDCYIRISNI